MPFTEITETHEFNDIIKSDKYSLIKFVAPWNSSYKKLDKIFGGISDVEDFEDKPIKFYTVNVERFTLPNLGIKTLPVTILFHRGSEITRTLAVDLRSIVDMIDRIFPLTADNNARTEPEEEDDDETPPPLPPPRPASPPPPPSPENVEQPIYRDRGYYSD